ncbi:MAG: prolyl oligopeptidase family serine peptidase [Acidobacteriota bacterium]|nr:prolyl oligopeptidase family serine peptidase [Acidobacteriota bacterium]
MRIRVLPGLCLFALLSLSAASKRPLTHQDYGAWRTIHSQTLSRDGHYLAYALFPQEGDGELVVRDLVTGKEWREPVGEQPPPPKADPFAEEPPKPRGLTLQFTSDVYALAFSAFPSKAELGLAKKNKAVARGGMGVMDLASGATVRTPQVKSFQAPEKTAGFIAYLKDTDSKEFGSDLVLRNLTGGSERVFPDVLEYSVTKDGKTLAYAVSSRNAETDGLYALAVETDAKPRAILSGKGKYEKLAWDEKQSELAFVSDRDDASAKQPEFQLYLWQRQSPSAEAAVSRTTPGFRRDFVISDKAAPSFSQDGQRLFFGTAPQPRAEAVATPAEDRVQMDLWNWKDDYIQPMQKARAASEKTRTFRAVYNLPAHAMVQLADRTMSEITPSESGRWALGGDDREYRPMAEYDERFSDSYLVDTATGSRKLLSKKHTGRVTWSPDGRYALLFNGKDWSSISVPLGKSTDLTGKLPVKFWTEDNDTAGTPRSYGLAGWTRDGKYVLLYDHYDIWQIAPDGSSAKNLTDGFGRKEKIEFRYVKLDVQEKSIDPAQPLLLRAENTVTRDSGFYRARVDSDELPRKILMASKNFTPPSKAKEADVLLLTESTFSEFPDLLVTDSSMKELRKVSDANPQRSQFLWGTDELVNFKNADGVPLTGVLYKPENFDPRKKYPMLVYIYERLSQNMNRFVDPRPGHSINITYYVSNGYLVFTPDIVYTVGYPGQSALKCVLPGVEAVVERGFVDENAIGIQGHSWGGYQIAYMITQTNRFRAVEAGAPVANMTSAYDGIRWGPGMPRQFQYERTQSRIGGTLWQYPMRYIENSPVFMADRVKTPVMILANDADDAVPWYQGIEYYLALRRLGKEVYLFDYNGEPHHLLKRANQKDYTVRMQQYFDYYLKGAPKPDWMEHGIAYLDRR